MIVRYLTEVSQRNDVHDTEMLVGPVTLHWYVELSSDPAMSTITSDDVFGSHNLLSNGTVSAFIRFRVAKHHRDWMCIVIRDLGFVDVKRLWRHVTLDDTTTLGLKVVEENLLGDALVQTDLRIPAELDGLRKTPLSPSDARLVLRIWVLPRHQRPVVVAKTRSASIF